jgi:predicted nucleotidyltransferase
MRLLPNAIFRFRQLLRETDPAGKIFLFGSRIDDRRRGGDIDIFMETSRHLDLKTVLSLENRLAAVCDEHVDLLIKNPGQSEQPIHFIARQGIPL